MKCTKMAEIFSSNFCFLKKVDERRITVDWYEQRRTDRKEHIGLSVYAPDPIAIFI